MLQRSQGLSCYVTYTPTIGWVYFFTYYCITACFLTKRAQHPHLHNVYVNQTAELPQTGPILSTLLWYRGHHCRGELLQIWLSYLYISGRCNLRAVFPARRIVEGGNLGPRYLIFVVVMFIAKTYLTSTYIGTTNKQLPICLQQYHVY